ncbi:putative transmembrane protein [Heterostelium album PN500]|uniref:Putative transmembrane protein n=1 Tax=Heterostelium pallidum (strain ATCC 26659 / Pp 5 / PN500) TaxID=670386 RepID=D3B414_HETP5|nr:putative transmembrane protein [Heterostelium album PN500]EFA84062.1 putative transmembrane protein [Heterostelium album PN500]|eukprot:XP_020436179.1 putative transmembrane protein [Heterostelium album PN500]
MSSQQLHQRAGRSEKGKELDKLIEQFYNSSSTQEQQEKDKNKKPINPKLKWIKKKLEALFWLSLGVALAYYTDLLDVILHSDKVDRFYFNIGLVGLFVFFVLYINVAYIYGARNKSSLDWEKEFPNSIRVATASLIITTIGFICGFWPIWVDIVVKFHF